MRRELEPWLTGRLILEANLVDAPPGPKYANLPRAVGQRIESVDRRGKFLLLPLSGPDELIIHLGMTGIVTPVEPEGHTRVHLRLDPGPNERLYFRDVRRFGRFLVVPRGDYSSLPTLHAMGPEPLSAGFTTAAFAGLLARSEVAIKTYLLSQKPVAGVGNIYADEALWQARIHPLTPAKRVPKAKIGPLRDAIRSVLEASIEMQGTTLNDYRTPSGGEGGFLAQLAVYSHEGEPCQRCGTPIERIVIAGRSTHYCPHCQRLPRKRRAKEVSSAS